MNDQLNGARGIVRNNSIEKSQITSRCASISAPAAYTRQNAQIVNVVIKEHHVYYIIFAQEHETTANIALLWHRLKTVIHFTNWWYCYVVAVS